MNYKNLYADTTGLLVKKIAAEFVCGISLIENLDDETYTRTVNGTGSIGAHFRHNLDFTDGFLNGLKKGKIDYNRRERDVRIEQNRQYAVERFVFLICRLRTLPPEICRQPVLISSEVEENVWHPSSVARELEFLHSHMVHHHAIVAEKLNSFGIKVSADFGVAPSSLKFWAEQKKAA